MLKQIQARLAKQEVAEVAKKVFMCVISDGTNGKLEVGKDCVRLTKKYSKYGVSCHALPNIEALDGDPVFAIIGPTKASVTQAATAYHKDSTGENRAPDVIPTVSLAL